jgi:tetratricopeptide (TPR) repeat protein
LFAVIPHPPSPAARDAPGAIEALELAYAHVEGVREADTPTLEDHEVRKHHLNMLTLASKQLDAARKLDPDAILEGQDKKGIIYRFSINELEAEALLIEGITLHAYDIKRAVRALRKATTLNANSSYAFYVLGLMHAANMNKGEAVAALQRAVALKPQNLSYRKELNRAQCLSIREIAAYNATRAGESIFEGGIKAWNIIAGIWNIVRFPRRVFLSIYLGILSIYRGVFRLLGFPRLH